jgi:hypothetical protein
MGKPSLCGKCKKRQLTSVADFEPFSHAGYCQQCAEEEVKRFLGILVYYERISENFLELLDDPIALEGMARRIRRLREIEYPQKRDVGLLVAVSRQYQADGIEQHQQILKKYGKVVFGKFRFTRSGVGSTALDLENAGRERYEGVNVSILSQRVSDHLQQNRLLYLYILDPDPPASLWRGLIDTVSFSTAGQDNATFTVPEFKVGQTGRLIPSYYWFEDESQELKYHCNFWFLLRSLEAIDPKALSCMEDLEREEAITLATSQLYPAEVAVEPTCIDILGARQAELQVSEEEPGRVRVAIGSIIHALKRVKFTKRARRDLERCHNDMLHQVIDLVIQMERAGSELQQMAVRKNKVGTKGLMEFAPTAAGRVAAGWLGGKWWIVGINEDHKDHFWQEMTQAWREEI